MIMNTRQKQKEITDIEVLEGEEEWVMKFYHSLFYLPNSLLPESIRIGNSQITVSGNRDYCLPERYEIEVKKTAL